MLCAPLLNTINRFVRKVQKNGKTAKFRAQLQALPIFLCSSNGFFFVGGIRPFKAE